ncbi:MAG: hypothetical protein EXR72_08995 [Myxococcales bacterium]|nr:hypothetical protein [Myxococcales bacterium]
MDLIIDLIILLVKALTKKEKVEAPATVTQRRFAPPPAPRMGSKEVADLAARLQRIERAARDEARRCAGEEQNERFVDTLLGYVATAAGRGRTLLGGSDAGSRVELVRSAEYFESLLEVMTDLAQQRRDPARLLLLGDADALADACYRPVVEFARTHGIKLSSQRTATMLIEGDGCRHTLEAENLSILIGFNPTGLAPILLPASWGSEPGWWPALAHEIGHDFLASVPGLDGELRRACELSGDGWLPDGGVGFTGRDLDAAFTVWLPEIFADAFGTLMLGPAFIETLIWSLGDPQHPENVIGVPPGPGWMTWAPHPPHHLRVVLGCRLLAEIGFPGEAARLESEWRARHGGPDALFFPTRRQTWIGIADEAIIRRGESITHVIYQDELASLAGFELRSIPGLDLGPREHEAAREACRAYFAGQRAPTRDPRALIAGAVLAWSERPSLAPSILRAARATIPSVGVARRVLRRRADSNDARAAGPRRGGVDLADWREAMVLSAILDRPRGLPRR